MRAVTRNIQFYCNVLMLANLKAQLLLFADDLVLVADSESGLQDSMDRLDEFCNTWDLKINTEKTKVVIFNKPRSQLIPIFKIGSSTIEYSTHYKYLGIILSENGSYKPAITTLANQASSHMPRPASFFSMRIYGYTSS